VYGRRARRCWRPTPGERVGVCAALGEPAAPDDMKPDAWRRSIAARDSTWRGFTCSSGRAHQPWAGDHHPHAEKQIRRLRASEYAEARELGGEWPRHARLNRTADGTWEAAARALAPTLARHAEPDRHGRAVAGRPEALGGTEPAGRGAPRAGARTRGPGAPHRHAGGHSPPLCSTR